MALMCQTRYQVIIVRCMERMSVGHIVIPFELWYGVIEPTRGSVASRVMFLIGDWVPRGTSGGILLGNGSIASLSSFIPFGGIVETEGKASNNCPIYSGRRSVLR